MSLAGSGPSLSARLSRRCSRILRTPTTLAMRPEEGEEGPGAVCTTQQEEAWDIGQVGMRGEEKDEKGGEEGRTSKERGIFSPRRGGGEGKKSFPPRWADKRSDSRRILSIQTPQRECPRDSTKGGRRVREEGGGAFSLLLFNLLAMLLTVVRCQRSTSLGSRKEGGEGGVSLYVSRVHALVRTYHRGQYGSSRIDADCLHVWTCLFVYVGVEVRVLRSVGAYYFCSCTRGGCIETGRLTDKEGSWFPRVRINLLTRFFLSSSRGR